MKYFPDPKVSVPAVELMPLSSSADPPQNLPDAGLQAPSLCDSPCDSPLEVFAPSTDPRLPIIDEFLQVGDLEANSRRAYERALRRFLDWSTLPFAVIQPDHMAQYQSWLETTPTPRTGNPLARSSVNLEMVALKRFFAWLNASYPCHCPSNPTVVIKSRQIAPVLPEPISPAALDWIRKALPHLGRTTSRDTVLVHLLAHGLRAGEAVGLNLSSFDGENLFVAQTKTHAARLVPLSHSSRLLLAQYLDWRQTELQEVLQPDTPLLISLHAAHKGKRLSYIGIYQAIERIGKRARQSCLVDWIEQQEQAMQAGGESDPARPPHWWDQACRLRLKCQQGQWDQDADTKLLQDLPAPVRQVVNELATLHPHNFRHTYATQLLLKGLDPVHAQKLTGYQSQQGFRRYQECAQQVAIDTLRQLEASGSLPDHLPESL